MLRRKLTFQPIDPSAGREKLIQFRRDSFIVSFGHEEEFSPDEYIEWLQKKACDFSDGFVHVFEQDQLIGQLELSTRKYEEKRIGYVHLFYLIPEKRGLGFGRLLGEYARSFFENQGVQEYHLRVSPSNKQAIQFYRSIGMEEIGPELGGKVVRMKGDI